MLISSLSFATDALHENCFENCFAAVASCTSACERAFCLNFFVSKENTRDELFVSKDNTRDEPKRDKPEIDVKNFRF